MLLCIQPKDAADRCLDCPAHVETTCPYSAKKLYLGFVKTVHTNNWIIVSQLEIEVYVTKPLPFKISLNKKKCLENSLENVLLTVHFCFLTIHGNKENISNF